MCDKRTMQSYRKNLMQYFRSVSIVETEKQRASVSTTTDNANEGEREKKISESDSSNVAVVYDVKPFCGSAVDSYSIMANA